MCDDFTTVPLANREAAHEALRAIEANGCCQRPHPIEGPAPKAPIPVRFVKRYTNPWRRAFRRYEWLDTGVVVDVCVRCRQSDNDIATPDEAKAAAISLFAEKATL